MEKFLIFLVATIVVLGLGALGAWIVMLLWNWVAPLFWCGAPILGFWQTWGALILLSIIGSFFRRGKNE